MIKQNNVRLYCAIDDKGNIRYACMDEYAVDDYIDTDQRTHKRERFQKHEIEVILEVSI